MTSPCRLGTAPVFPDPVTFGDMLGSCICRSRAQRPLQGSALTDSPEMPTGAPTYRPVAALHLTAGPAPYLQLLQSGIVPYPGLEWLGMGYDLFRGNPEGGAGGKVDPGLRLPAAVSKATDPTGLSSDNKHPAPPRGYAWPLAACAMDSQFRRSATAGDYANYLGIDLHVEKVKSFSVGGLRASAEGSMKFSASNGFHKFQRNVEAKSHQRFEV